MKNQPTPLITFSLIPDSEDVKIQDPQTKETHRITPGEAPKQVDSVTITPPEEN